MHIYFSSLVLVILEPNLVHFGLILMYDYPNYAEILIHDTTRTKHLQTKERTTH